MTPFKTYAKKSTAELIAVKLAKQGKGEHTVKPHGGEWGVFPVEAKTPVITEGDEGQPVINPDLVLGGSEDSATNDTTDVSQSLSAPETDTASSALVTFMVQPAKITTEYVIVKAGPLGKERWFQLSRLHSATKVDDGVQIVCTRTELISRGLKELAAKAPVFNVDAAAAEANDQPATEQDGIEVEVTATEDGIDVSHIETPADAETEQASA